MNIRTATIADVDELTELRLAFLAEVRGLDRETLRGSFAAATAEFLRSSLASGALHCWVAEEDDRAVGLVAVIRNLVPPRPNQHRPYEGYIINMYVQPSHRGRGVARALLETCLASRDQLAIARFTLHATAEGRPLYETLGFQPNDDWLELPPARC